MDIAISAVTTLYFHPISTFENRIICNALIFRLSYAVLNTFVNIFFTMREVLPV